MRLSTALTPVRAILVGVLSAALAITAVPFGAALVASAAPGQAGVISGSVLVSADLAATGIRPAAAGEVTVELYRVENGVAGHSLGSTTTQANGLWSTAGFAATPVGEYTVRFDYVGSAELNVLDTWLGGAYTAGEAANNGHSFIVGEAGRSGITQTLDQAARLSGLVVDNDYETLPGQNVTAWRQTIVDGSYAWEVVAGTVTATTGRYSFKGLHAGRYTLEFGGQKGYLHRWWDGSRASSADEADSFEISTGPTRSTYPDFDAYLGRAGSISGVVKNAGKAPIGGIEVTAFDNWDQESGPVAHTVTSASGAYTLAGLEQGGYVIRFASPSSAAVTYVSEYYNNRYSFEDATAIELGDGQALAGRNAELARGAAVSGTVSAWDGADLTAQFTVTACLLEARYILPNCDSDFGFVNYSAGGRYTIASLPPGKYTIRVAYTGDGNYQDEFFDNRRILRKASLFAVGTSGTVAGRNVVLDAGATITGTATFDGSPAAGVSVVSTAEADTDITDAGVRRATTDEEGRYSITGLSLGYQALFADTSTASNANEALSQYYGGSTLVDEVVPVFVTPPEEEAGVDFALQRSGSISGVVTGKGNQPLGNVSVSVYPEFTPSSWDERSDLMGLTNAAGSYTIPGIAPGRYRVEFSSWDESEIPYLEQSVGALPGQDVSHGSAVTVAPTESTSVNMQLTLGGALTGRVIDANGDVLVDQAVQLSLHGTDPGVFAGGDGRYVFTDESGDFVAGGLTSGLWDVRASTESGLVTSTPLASAVSVTAGEDPVALGTLQLGRGSRISGVISAPTGAPLPNEIILATILTSDGRTEVAGVGFSDESGRFEITSLPAGNVYLWNMGIWRSGVARYPAQYLGGSSDIQAATPVVLGENDDVYREFRLSASGSFGGTVTNAATRKAIGGVYVEARRIDPVTGTVAGEGPSARTTAKGGYSIPGLEAGAYEVSYNRIATGTGVLPVAIATARVQVPENSALVKNVALATTTRLTGIVKDAEGKPLDGVAVQAFRWDGSSATEGSYDAGRDVGTTSATGAYSLYLGPGTYVIRFLDPEARAPVGYLGGGAYPADSATKKLVVGAKALVGNVVLGSAAGSVTAVIRDATGRISVDGFVDLELLSGASTLDSVLLDTSDLSRALPLRGLRDGDYRLTVSPWTWDEAYTIPDRVVTFTLDGGVLTVVDGEPATSPHSLGTIVLGAAEPLPVPVLATGEPLPAISGVPTVGQTLVASAGTWTPEALTLGYQWYRNGRPIAGATENEYTVAPGDAGKRLSFSITPNAALWYAPQPSFRSSASEIVELGDAPVATAAPQISGIARVGGTLTAASGAWSRAGVGFGFEWVRGGTVVGTLPTYKPVAADVAAGIVLRVTASRAGYQSGSAEVSTTVAYGLAPRATRAPRVIAGPTTFSAAAGTFTPAGVTQSFAWEFFDPTSNTVDPARTISGQVADAAAIAAGDDRVELVVTATKAGYAPAVLRLPVRSGSLESVGIPVILGTPQLGVTLTASPGAVGTLPTATGFGYQWFRGAAKIPGATKAAYTPVALDVNKQLSVRVQAIQAGYRPGAVLGSDPVTVAPAAPFVVGSVTVAGNAAVGRAVTASTGVWTPAPTAFAYQWFRVNGETATVIPKATKASYIVTAADRGLTLRVRVTGTRAGYTTSVATSGPSAAVVDRALDSTAAPTLPVVARVGTALLATAGRWDIAPTAYGYQWFVNDRAIIGATAAAYTPISSDLGEDLRVEVTASRAGFPAGLATSAEVTVLEGAAPRASVIPTLSVNGKAVRQLKNGQLVRATGGTWPTGGVALTYQWQVKTPTGSWTDIVGETSRELYLESDIGNSFRMRVVAEKAGYASSLPVYSTALVLRP